MVSGTVPSILGNVKQELLTFMYTWLLLLDEAVKFPWVPFVILSISVPNCSLVSWFRHYFLSNNVLNEIRLQSSKI